MSVGVAYNNEIISVFIAHSGIIKSGRGHTKGDNRFATELIVKTLREGSGEGREPSVGVVI